MKEQEVIERGTAAEFLLKDETFQRTVQRLIDQNINIFLNSTPTENDVRDIAYHTSRALSDIVNTLQQEALMKAQIMEQNDNE